MAASSVQYLGDGVTSLFTVPFEYLDKTHVSATVNGAASSMTWVGEHAVRLAPTPAANSLVELIRKTPADKPLVDFVDGSVLTEHDLDLTTRQLLFVAQDAAEKAARALGLSSMGTFDARALEIVNVAPPTTPDSAATRKWTENAVQGAVEDMAARVVFVFVEKSDPA